MKKFLALSFSLLLTSKAAVAAPKLDLVDLELQRTATHQAAYASTQKLSFLGFDLTNPFDLIKNIKEQLDGLKQTLIDSYDANGNGRIDFGPELNNLVDGTKMLVKILLDTNYDGKIETSEVVDFAKSTLSTLELSTLTTVCPAIEKQATASGDFLTFRPVLAHLNTLCLAKVSSPAN